MLISLLTGVVIGLIVALLVAFAIYLFADDSRQTLGGKPMSIKSPGVQENYWRNYDNLG